MVIGAVGVIGPFVEQAPVPALIHRPGIEPATHQPTMEQTFVPLKALPKNNWPATILAALEDLVSFDFRPQLSALAFGRPFDV